MAPYVAAPDMRLCEPVSVIYRAVSGTSKRKLENGEQRLPPENHRPGTKASKLPARDSGTLAFGVGTGAGRHLSLQSIWSLQSICAEFPPDDPTRTGEGLQKVTGEAHALRFTRTTLASSPYLGTLIPRHRSWAPAPPRVRRSDRNRRSVRGCRGSEHAWQHRASTA